MLLELGLHGFLTLVDLSASSIFCEVHVEMETEEEESRWTLRRKKASMAPRRRSRKRDVRSVRTAGGTRNRWPETAWEPEGNCHKSLPRRPGCEPT